VAQTSAERMRAYRQRQAAARRELVRLREDNERLEAELEQVRATPAPARCQQCGTTLACPQCQGGGEYA
jgi:rubrerythrin